MDGPSRQQRRQAARERIKAGTRALKKGLAPRPEAPDVLAITAVLKAKLEERGNPARAGEAAAVAHELMGASLATHPGKAAIVCSRGCSYCCYSYVAALAPEVFRLASAVRASRSAELAAGAVVARAKLLQGLGVGDRIGRKLACPLLVGGECGVYAERPLVCRQATSLSLKACIDEYENPDREGQIEISSAHVAHSSNAMVLLMAALKAVKLPSDSYELSEALAVALTDPDAERKWLAGEDVFHVCARHVSDSRDIEIVSSGVATMLEE